MCFLYRQSISIVYESKFKYIYRYFIKIDRCFCGILQSLPLRKCGLKFRKQSWSRTGCNVTSLAEVWIEISFLVCFTFCWIGHFPCGSVDWNFFSLRINRLKSVTSLAEVWIEICSCVGLVYSYQSLPLRKCGLKSRDWSKYTTDDVSLPLRKCGLK